MNNLHRDTVYSNEKICTVCGKIFYTHSSEYTYKLFSGRHIKFFCGYNCMREYEKNHKKKVSKLLSKEPLDEDLIKRPTKCQWTRFHDKWIEDNLNEYKKIVNLCHAFNEHFLLDISDTTFRQHVKIVRTKIEKKHHKRLKPILEDNLNEVPSFDRMQWTRFHRTWIRDNLNNYKNAAEMYPVFKEKYLLDLTFSSFYYEYKQIKSGVKYK